MLALWLLHGFDETQLSDPATYERLIAALRSDQVSVRELAAWRLRQIDPEGCGTWPNSTLPTRTRCGKNRSPIGKGGFRQEGCRRHATIRRAGHRISLESPGSLRFARGAASAGSLAATPYH